jgi:LemA protein
MQEGWSGIDIQLKKRYELIPNIVTTVKGYAAHESAVLEKVTEYRGLAMNSSQNSTNEPESKLAAENMLAASLKSLLSVSENYPDLKADASFLKLQTELSQIERDLERARRYYNGCVRELNTQIASFPHNLVSAVLGFKSAQFFEASESEKENVELDLNK